MAKDVKTQPCPECGGLMRYEKHDDVLTYKGKSRTIKTLGWWCTKCDEAILTGDPLVAHEKAFQVFKAEIDGVLNPAEVAAIRAALGLSQRRASELLGGGPRAFQKYESGTQALSVPMSHLLRLLANDPSRLRELSGPTTFEVFGQWRGPEEAPLDKAPIVSFDSEGTISRETGSSLVDVLVQKRCYEEPERFAEWKAKLKKAGVPITATKWDDYRTRAKWASDPEKLHDELYKKYRKELGAK